MSEAEWVRLSEVPSIADESWLEGQNGAPIEQTSDSWLPLNLADLDEAPPVKPDLGGLGLVYPGKRHVFSGPQESAKTLAAYVIGLEVIRGGGSVWLIDFEMGPWDARTRLRELGATVAELTAIHYVEPDVPADERLIGRIVEQAPGLVIIDAIAGAFDLHQLDDNARKDVEKFARIWLQPFRRAGIATIALDHVTKNVEGRGKYAIGSERKVGGADVHLGFEVVHPIKRGGHGLYKIVTHKDRGGFLKRGKLAEFELQSDPDTNVIKWALKVPVETDEAAPFRPTGIMEKVSRFLEIQSETVSMNTLRSQKMGKHDYVDMAIAILVQEGFIEESPGANRARLFESLAPYREGADNFVQDSHIGSPQVRPEFAPEPGNPSSPVRPTPYGGAHGERFAPAGAPGSPQGSLEDDDGIPF